MIRIPLAISFIILLAITPSLLYGQKLASAVMTVSARVVQGGTADSNISGNINLSGDSTYVGDVKLAGIPGTKYLISFQKMVKLKNEKGKNLDLNMQVQKEASGKNKMTRYKMMGNVSDYQGERGLFKGTILAKIEYL